MPTFSASAGHRRPLATAAAAGGLLFALWFVPSANASQEEVDSALRTVSTTSPGSTGSPAAPAVTTAGHRADERAASGDSFDPAPYLVAGTGLLGAGGWLAFRLTRGGEGGGRRAARRA